MYGQLTLTWNKVINKSHFWYRKAKSGDKKKGERRCVVFLLTVLIKIMPPYYMSVISHHRNSHNSWWQIKRTSSWKINDILNKHISTNLLCSPDAFKAWASVQITWFIYMLLKMLFEPFSSISTHIRRNGNVQLKINNCVLLSVNNNANLCFFYLFFFPMCCCWDSCLCGAFSTGNVLYLFSLLLTSFIHIILQGPGPQITVSKTSVMAMIEQIPPQ